MKIENIKYLQPMKVLKCLRIKRNKYIEGIYYPIKGYISDLIEPLIPKVVENNTDVIQPIITSQTDIEAKKADIERRRQEELKGRVIYDTGFQQ